VDCHWRIPRHQRKLFSSTSFMCNVDIFAAVTVHDYHFCRLIGCRAQHSHTKMYLCAAFLSLVCSQPRHEIHLIELLLCRTGRHEFIQRSLARAYRIPQDWLANAPILHAHITSQGPRESPRCPTRDCTREIANLLWEGMACSQ